MKRSFIIILVITLIIGLTITANIYKKASAMNLIVNVKDFPEYGVELIPSSDPSFDDLAVTNLKHLTRNQVNSVKPFSVFLKNTSSKQVVAFVIKWEVVMNDGTVKTHVSSEASPGILMGENAPKDEALDKLSKAVKPNHVRFCSWAGSLADPKMGSLSGSSLKGDEAYVQNIIQGQNIQALNEYSVTQLRQATRLEITVDGAFFEDGTFVGPNTTGYFERIEAQIKAKRDIIQETINGLQQEKKPHEALQHLERLSSAPDVVFSGEPTVTEHYNFWKKQYAQEFAGVRMAHGDERAAIYMSNLYRKPWPALRRKDKIGNREKDNESR